jgi:hypothetical protein
MRWTARHPPRPEPTAPLVAQPPCGTRVNEAEPVAAAPSGSDTVMVTVYWPGSYTSGRLLGLPEHSLLRSDCGKCGAGPSIWTLTAQSSEFTFPPAPCDVQSKVIRGGLMLEGYDGSPQIFGPTFVRMPLPARGTTVTDWIAGCAATVTSGGLRSGVAPLSDGDSPVTPGELPAGIRLPDHGSGSGVSAVGGLTAPIASYDCRFSNWIANVAAPSCAFAASHGDGGADLLI